MNTLLVSSYLFIYIFICGCAGPSLLHVALSRCGEWWHSLVVVCGLLLVVASLVVGHKF